MDSNGFCSGGAVVGDDGGCGEVDLRREGYLVRSAEREERGAWVEAYGERLPVFPVVG